MLMALVLGKRRGWDSETHLEDKKKKNNYFSRITGILPASRELFSY